jgi:hypothetical protein
MDFDGAVEVTAAGQPLTGGEFQLRQKTPIGIDRRRDFTRHDRDAAAPARALAAAHRRQTHAGLPRGIEQVRIGRDIDPLANRFKINLKRASHRHPLTQQADPRIHTNLRE